MDDPTATPDPKDGSLASDTPPPDSEEELDEEPAAGDETEPEADQSAAPSPIAQAEYTRATQALAVTRRELGLPKGATQREIEDAIRALKVPAGDPEDEEGEPDPRVQAAYERAFTAEVRVLGAVYGDDFTADALSFINQARTSDDLNELVTGFAALRDKYPAQVAAASKKAEKAKPDEAADEDDEGLEGDIDLSEGDPASRQRESTSDGRGRRDQAGDGLAAHLRGILAQAGVGPATRK